MAQQDIEYDAMDNGNWGNKALGRAEHTTIRNVLVDFDGTTEEFEELCEVAERSKEEGDIPTDSVLLTLEGHQRIAGELGYLVDRHAQSKTGNDRFGSQEWHEMVAAGLTMLHPKKSCRIGLTYSIPVSQFRANISVQDKRGTWHEMKKRDYVRNLLCRTWEVERNGRELTYEILPDLFELVPEGYGTLASLCIAENGRRFTDRTLAESRVILVDIGGITTDILTFGKLQPLDYAESLTTGLIHVRNKVERAIVRRFNRDNVPPKILDQIIQTKKYAHAGYAPVDVSDIVEDATSKLVDDVLRVWTEELGRGADYAGVVFGGGGGPVIAPIIERQIDHGNIYFIPRGQAHDANARGMKYRRMMQLYAAQMSSTPAH
jgi:hypothetical protein